MLRSVSALLAGVATLSLAAMASAKEGPVPYGVRHLDHVFLIMMENHGYAEIIDNPNMPFTNKLAAKAGLATHYFAVGHPSLTNYLEIVGGSNFGVLNDHAPDWHNANCDTNLSTGQPALDQSSYPNICPLRGNGKDAATPAIDTSNLEGNQPGPVINIDGSASYPAQPTVAKTIAHQIVEKGGTWKTYQEDLPPTGADNVNSADGIYSNLNPPTKSGITDGVVGLYAVKHNPFAYFLDVQNGKPGLSLQNAVGFDGQAGLFEDLRKGHTPTLSFIVPNQCNDQHGRSGAGPQCDYDPNDVGTQTGLNPALMYQGDVTLERIVGAIKASPSWSDGRNAIVIVWDESDYANAPITNQVTLIVDTNESDRDHDHDADDRRGHTSSHFYTHYSLLKSLESALGLPCLNHACDATTETMNDLFDGRK
ncbi:Phosphoesterase precursor [Bradyrhizobium sp. STM 3809]|nr:Phosphoesterase precursor [Bradyrhizobium sp. STM 3809]